MAPAKNHDCDITLSVFMHIFQKAYEDATSNYEVYPPSLNWPLQGVHRLDEYFGRGRICASVQIIGAGIKHRFPVNVISAHRSAKRDGGVSVSKTKIQSPKPLSPTKPRFVLTAQHYQSFRQKKWPLKAAILSLNIGWLIRRYEPGRVRSKRRRQQNLLHQLTSCLLCLSGTEHHRRSQFLIHQSHRHIERHHRQLSMFR